MSPPGATLGPYTILAELGHGGMGAVYTAHDPRLDRQVAIEVLPPDLTRDDTAKRRFLQEAKAASALDHPHICTIHEINETDHGQLYLVRAYYEKGARHIGEFAIGFNPHIHRPMLDILFDQKIAGSFHFTPGQAHETADNGNRSYRPLGHSDDPDA